MTERRVVITVIYLVGSVACVLVAGVLLLTWLLLTQAGKRGTVDPVAVGAVGAVSTLAGTTIGYLGGLLTSTRSAPAGPVEVEVANGPADPVPVDPAPPGPPGP